MTMNGMEGKVAERRVALECNGEKRKLLAAGFGRKNNSKVKRSRLYHFQPIAKYCFGNVGKVGPDH
ncbi:MAG TPA: hypothetical protein DER09_03900 [Prolixibacteraceae bacterium]|nr:hypothetical protein [Prolixibacteraceae bacterium]